MRLVLVAHGSPSPGANQDVADLVGGLRLDEPPRLCFACDLEPSLAGLLATIAGDGADEPFATVVVPLFLLAGHHLPELVAAAAQSPRAFRVVEPVGADPGIPDVVRACVAEVAAPGASIVLAAQTSSDPAVASHLQRVASAAGAERVAMLRPAALPGLDDVLSTLPPRASFVVVPYVVSRGLVHDGIERRVRRFVGKRDVAMAPCVGRHPAFLQLLERRLREIPG